MTPTEYYRLLYQYNYMRILPALTSEPDSAPLSLTFHLSEDPSCPGDFPDYNLITIKHENGIWGSMNKIFLYPAFDALLIFMTQIASGISGSWVELYDYPGLSSASFERYSNSSLGRFALYNPDDEEVTPPVSMTIHGYTPKETYTRYAVSVCTVDYQELSHAFLQEMRHAYGHALLQNGSRFIHDDFLTDDEEPLETIRMAIAYWNWIRAFPGLFSTPQPLLGLTDFLTSEEIRKISTGSEDISSPIPPEPLLSNLADRTRTPTCNQS